MTFKRNNSFCTPCIKISWEDIENIVEIMGAGIKIYNDGYEYNSKEELEQKIKNSKTKLKELHFINNLPYISLDLKHRRMLERGRGGGRICASDSRGEILKIKGLFD
jgi:hypothetical protein